MLVRTQMNFPATGEVLAPWAIGHFVGGGMRGSHQVPIMPVPLGTGTSWFDGPPLVSCAAFSMHDGRLTEPIDAFAHPFWNTVREHVANKAMEMRRQGFVGALHCRAALSGRREMQRGVPVDRIAARRKNSSVEEVAHEPVVRGPAVLRSVVVIRA